jgi:hypothetical protein
MTTAPTATSSVKGFTIAVSPSTTEGMHAIAIEYDGSDPRYGSKQQWNLRQFKTFSRFEIVEKFLPEAVGGPKYIVWLMENAETGGGHGIGLMERCELVK